MLEALPQRVVDAVLRLHSESISTLQAFTRPDGGWETVEPDSAEAIIGTESICSACLTTWPCRTIQTIEQTIKAAMND